VCHIPAATTAVSTQSAMSQWRRSALTTSRTDSTRSSLRVSSTGSPNSRYRSVMTPYWESVMMRLAIVTTAPSVEAKKATFSRVQPVRCGITT
jgi:hypothetical protein